MDVAEIYFILFSVMSTLFWGHGGAAHVEERPYSNPHLRNLIKNMLESGYNKVARPRHSGSINKTYVKLGVSLTSIVDLDLKNQVLTTHVWLEQQWNDIFLQWDPHDYDGIDNFVTFPDQVWKPDIVLYNSADGNFTVHKSKYKVKIYYNGTLVWNPPASFKSVCEIDVKFFPFDTQQCCLKLGSWTHDFNYVDIYHKNLTFNDSMHEVTEGINLEYYSINTEWDLLRIPAEKFHPKYPCCPDSFPDIKFCLLIRRRPLFYVVNIIIPCVAICSVTVLVFYIPATSCEKITMGITVLNSMTVFLLLVVESSPPTSLATPLLGKYIVFTMVLITSSIVVTVIVINVHFASPVAREMPAWVRELFLHMLPKMLLMRTPRSTATPTNKREFERRHSTKPNKLRDDSYVDSKTTVRKKERNNLIQRELSLLRMEGMPKHVLATMIGVSSVADSLKQKEEYKTKWEDWQYVARVLDRLFLFIFITGCLIGTMGTILQAGSHYDSRPGLGPPQKNCHRVTPP